ncbi:hypothetical protein F4780DRAFT_194255 [Xylariomycetidae sp. FL0641]|nr:hypothetical protein F4780DRAFT_194255 [Xylariomycetidae sp. FL0641]
MTLKLPRTQSLVLAMSVAGLSSAAPVPFPCAQLRRMVQPASLTFKSRSSRPSRGGIDIIGTIPERVTPLSSPAPTFARK